MTAVYVRIFAGVVLLVTGGRGYLLAMQMAAVNRRARLNGSSGGVVRTIKRQMLIKILIGWLLANSGWRSWNLYSVYGIETLGPAVTLLRQSGWTFGAIGFLLVLDAILNEVDRQHNAELRMRERAYEDSQKRSTDPILGAPLQDEHR